MVTRDKKGFLLHPGDWSDRVLQATVLADQDDRRAAVRHDKAMAATGIAGTIGAYRVTALGDQVKSTCPERMGHFPFRLTLSAPAVEGREASLSPNSPAITH